MIYNMESDNVKESMYNSVESALKMGLFLFQFGDYSRRAWGMILFLLGNYYFTPTQLQKKTVYCHLFELKVSNYTVSGQNKIGRELTLLALIQSTVIK